MQIETYEVDEAAEETVECPEEATELIEKLGLDGQKELLCSNVAGGVTRCPFPAMSQEQMWVWEQICPEHVKINQYRRSSIPLRVLKTAAYAESLGFFDEIQVWDASSSAEKDPVLVGKIGGKNYGPATYYALARWGEHLDEWPALLSRACEMHKTKVIAKCKEIISLAEAKMAAMTATVGAESRELSVPSYYA